MTESDEQTSNGLENKLTEVFDLFDHERNKTIDFRELGTVIRAIGGVPTEAELENDPPNGYINFEKFLPAMIEAMEQQKYRSASEKELLKAFALLDPEKKGFIEASTLEKLMSTEGEAFTTEESEEMLAIATDIAKGKVNYREYVVQLTTFDDEN